MSHQHSHTHHHNGSNIQLAFLLNFGFAILEIIGGIITGSTAILSDAVHDFGDSLALALSFIFEKLGNKKPTSKYTYGYRRLSLIGAFINIIVLTVGTLFVLSEAIESLANPQVVKANGMIVLAIIGIIINGLSVLRMSGSKKILDKTVMMHLLEDLLGWIAVFFVSIAIYFTNWYILDPILSLGICLIIAKNIFENLKGALAIIMQSVPDEELFEEIQHHISEMHNVQSIDQIHMWTMDGEKHIFTSTIKVKDYSTASSTLQEIKKVLSHHGIEHSTIEII